MTDPRLAAIRQQAAAYPDGDLAYLLARLDRMTALIADALSAPTQLRAAQARTALARGAEPVLPSGDPGWRP